MIFMSVEKYKKDGEEEDDFFKEMEKDNIITPTNLSDATNKPTLDKK